MKYKWKFIFSLLLIIFASIQGKSQPILLKVLPDNAKNYISSNGNLYFTIGDSLWKSNGTPSGTVFVKEVGEPILRLTEITVGSFFYFLTTEISGKTALWKSNGYANNTLKVASYPEINPLLNFNNALILGINDGIHGYELWRITSGGIKTLVKDIYPGPSSGLGNEIVIFNDWLYFKATTPSGTNIWKSNATSITNLAVDVLFNDFNQLTVVNSQLFFTRNYITTTNIPIAELWKTNGSTPTTSLVFQDSEDDGCRLNISNLISYHNKLVFELIPDCGHADVNLYSSNGTPAGTVLFRSLLQDGYISRFLLIDDFLVFKTSVQGDPGVIGRTDATYDGTVPFHSLNSEPTRNFERVGDLLFFADHSDGSHGYPGTPNGYFQLYQSGLFYENTETLQEIFGGSYAGADNLTEANGKLFFTTQNLYNGAPPEERVLRLYYYNPSIAFSRSANLSLVSENKFEAYPNPSNESFNFIVHSENDDLATADIYTIEGVFVENLFQAKTTLGQQIKFVWDASKYQEGMYICKYNSGKDFKIMKIIKTNK